MATTVSYSASMRTRKTNSASNAKSSAASQEYYENTYNYVGIVHFAGMALSGKVITGISLRIVAAQAGYGTGHTKTVYVRKSNYQSASQSGITGLGYCGDALGTFTGAFYGNTSTYTLSGDLLNNLAAYIAEGNNTICLYNPSPVKSSQGYSTNYLQWSECTITVTYEEAASKPSLSKTSFDMGTYGGHDLYEPAEQHRHAHHSLQLLFGKRNDCHGRNHLLHMDAARFTGRADSKRDLRLGHHSVRHLCEWFVGLNQYLRFSADGARIRCTVHLVRINR